MIRPLAIASLAVSVLIGCGQLPQAKLKTKTSPGDLPKKAEPKEVNEKDQDAHAISVQFKLPPDVAAAQKASDAGASGKQTKFAAYEQKVSSKSSKKPSIAKYPDYDESDEYYPDEDSYDDDGLACDPMSTPGGGCGDKLPPIPAPEPMPAESYLDPRIQVYCAEAPNQPLPPMARYGNGWLIGGEMWWAPVLVIGISEYDAYGGVSYSQSEIPLLCENTGFTINSLASSSTYEIDALLLDYDYLPRYVGRTGQFQVSEYEVFYVPLFMEPYQEGGSGSVAIEVIYTDRTPQPAWQEEYDETADDQCGVQALEDNNGSAMGGVIESATVKSSK